MKIVDEDELNRHRGPGPCGYCGRWFQVRHAAHLLGRGMGGGNRLDTRLNLIALCPEDHAKQHMGKRPDQRDLIEAVATREKMHPADLSAILYRFQRAPSGATVCCVCVGKGCWVCDSQGIFDRSGEPWQEQPRTFAGGKS